MLCGDIIPALYLCIYCFELPVGRNKDEYITVGVGTGGLDCSDYSFLFNGV